MKVIFFDKLESTQEYARKMDLVSEPCVVMTDYQINGFGRSGPWISDKKDFTATYIFQKTQLFIKGIYLVVAYIVLIALEKFNKKFYIKWSNDILDADYNKVVGILIDNFDNLLIGIGADLGFLEIDKQIFFEELNKNFNELFFQENIFDNLYDKIEEKLCWKNSEVILYNLEKQVVAEGVYQGICKKTAGIIIDGHVYYERTLRQKNEKIILYNDLA